MRRRAPSGLLLAIDVSERLPVGVADDEAGVGFLDGPGRREVALRHSRYIGHLLKRYSTLTGITTTTIGQLRKQQLSLADNPTWVAYNERLFEGLRKAGMPEE